MYIVFLKVERNDIMKKVKNNKKRGMIAIANANKINWDEVKEFIGIIILGIMFIHAIDVILWPDIHLVK